MQFWSTVCCFSSRNALRSAAYRMSSLHPTPDPTPPPRNQPTEQKAGEDTKHAAKKAAISAETGADVVKQEAKGFGARLWGKGQVRVCSGLIELLHDCSCLCVQPVQRCVV
jgi:hypothetical protein